MTTYALGFPDIDRSALPLVGGKGANLGELVRIRGVRVPDGFCVTTAAFRVLAEHSGELDRLLGELARLDPAARAAIAETSGRIRELIEGAPVPPAVASAIAERVAAMGEGALAVRSSATAEDLPTASFAGLQDTYLNVIGLESVLAHVRRCWASLFTERAVTYRMQGGIDHRRVKMAVVIQRMVFPEVAGILFTADPVTSNRKVSSIDASFGLGEALVSGLVSADTYRVRDGAILERRIARKELEVVPAEGGGTRQRAVEPGRRDEPALADDRIAELERVGRAIEAHVGGPQDIEWCLAGGELYILQSRPITTLYPLPEVKDDAPHVYLSVGHQQMMTDAIRPLGLSFWLMTTPAPMLTAGGRLFIDVAPMLASPARATVVDTLGRYDPLIKDLLTVILDRGFVPPAPPAERPAPPPGGVFGPPPPIEDDPAIVAGLVERGQASIAAMRRAIEATSGPALFDFILEDLKELKRHLFDPQGAAAIRAAMDAAAWINEHVAEWLGDECAADTLSQSVPGNCTSEMGLALLDVADAVRPYPQVAAYLERASDETFLDGLAPLEGGREASAAIGAFLDSYGSRCAGEIDITRPRWAEAPTTLVPLILGNVKMFAPGESRRRFERGLEEARAAECDILDRLRRLPGGEDKAEETRAKIRLLRTFIGYREVPKFGMVQRYFEYRKAILREARRLVVEGVLRAVEDVYFLTFAELHELVRTGSVDRSVIDARREAHAHHERLAPPRVMTSEGEIVTGAYRRESLPPGALVGLPVSAGVVEGRARVIKRLEDAALEEGDILVTAFTDPSWTPLFVSVKGLVTEVGGLMTHGAVIAREYGLPAVVCVDGATRRIADGQRIRVNGTDGYVELLPPARAGAR